MSNFICMGSYYGTYPNLVKTICRAMDSNSGESIICFSKIEKGGCCSTTFFMSESEFKNMYCS